MQSGFRPHQSAQRAEKFSFLESLDLTALFDKVDQILLLHTQEKNWRERTGTAIVLCVDW